jgi:signal transduction histidine kinase
MQTLSFAVRRPVESSRFFLYALLVAFNICLWLLLGAFHWEISLRAREVHFFGRQLFPLRTQAVPLPVFYAACAFLTAASAWALHRDRSNLAARWKLQSLVFQLLESLEIGAMVLDQKGILALANESARRLLPGIPDDSSGRHFLTVFSRYPTVQEIITRAIEKGAFARQIERSLGSSEDSRTFRITIQPLKDLMGRVTGTLLLLDDIQEVVEMERQIGVAERLSALGTLAAALAHEIRNPLEAMNLNLKLLERSLEIKAPEAAVGDKRQKYVRVIASEVTRLAGIVENFLSFSRPGGGRVTQVHLDRILQAVVELIRNQAAARQVEIVLKVKELPLTIEGSEDQLRQVFLNLVINGMEAMPEGGSLFIGAQRDLRPGSESPVPIALVQVRDSGEGIPPENIGRLFDPFFSTRPRGTGLGLTMAHRFVLQHRGRIRVDSIPGKGSTFAVELPLANRGN